jgi:lipopolysaccharide export system protein LptA
MFQKNRGEKPVRSIPWLVGAVTGLVLLLAVPPTEGAETFNFRGDRMETLLIGGRERIRLSGDARIDSEEYTIRAREIELYGQDYTFALCRGDVQVTNRERGIEITSDELLYDRKRKTTRMQGNAMMVDRKNEMVIKGGLIEDWEERQETLIQIGVRILKTDLVCRAEFARYLREPETVELSGMPFVQWKGDEYQATKIFVDLKNDRIRLEGDIRGKVVQDAAEEDEDERARPGNEP